MNEERAKRRDELASRLDRHPELHARLERLLDLVENTGGDLKRADEAERRAIEELRVMGQEILRGWAQRRADEESQVLEKTGGFVRQVKKTPLAQHLR